MLKFVQQCGKKVIGVLHGFDRLRFRGTLRSLAYVKGMMEHLWQTKVLLKDFGQYVEGVTEQVRAGVERTAEQADRPLKYLASSGLEKEVIAREIAAADGIREGLICVLSCVEPCRSYEIHRSRERKMLELRNVTRKCLHYYFYLQHPRVGFMSIRQQSWLPLDIRVCLNGREWLCRELDLAGVGYRRRDNCLVAVDNLKRAQRVLDRQLKTDWPHLLDQFAQLALPDLARILPEFRQSHYWSLSESEWASDVMFSSPGDLAGLYPSLVEHALRSFGSRDVMRFLGRKVPTHGGVHGHFNKELVSDLKHRPEGLRVKHRLGANSLKMYDKQGSVLRVETTINDPSDFKVYRTKEGDDQGPKAWLPLRKGVADVHRRAQVSQAANERYLDGLAAAKSSTPLAELTASLVQPARFNDRSVRALNPLSPADAALLAAVNRGEFSINGFRNRDLQALLYAASNDDAAEHRRRSAAVTRQLRMLRAHKLIEKVQKTHRYQLTDFGRRAIAALLAARQADAATLTAAA